MDVRCGFIIKNVQSRRKKAFNARQLRGQVNPKGLPILFELCYLKSILLSYIIKLYYLKSFRFTSRLCREKEQLVELYIQVPIIVFFRSSKNFFEPNSLAVSPSLLNKNFKKQEIQAIFIKMNLTRLVFNMIWHMGILKI